ncbi:hypothetical protein ACL02O_06325 [Micromonospora sp. MS34]|uniref:hypothetical protein n=1 Tax=Micromonospora sp. MS34 TaxID=3385971 RepID=UPI00399F7483
MGIAALVTWLITAAGGFVMLGTWISHGGHRPGSGSRLAPGLVFAHFALAAIGLVLWIAYLVVDNDAVAWVAFAALLPVALLGFTMLARWIAARRSGTAESRFPVPVVVGHGLFAAATLALTALAALGVGGR